MDMLNRYPKIPRNGACLYFVLSCAVQIGKAVASHEPFWENIIACQQLMCYLFLLHAIISPQKRVLEKIICILTSEMQSNTSKLSLTRLQRFLSKGIKEQDVL
jgi:hypothetical protein